MDDILKFGTEELFKEEEAIEKQAEEKGEETSRIVYDIEAVEKLCDRSQESQLEREDAMNEYLDSFKVATYTVKEGEEVMQTLFIPCTLKCKDIEFKKDSDTME